jgi:hypothetical protein
MFKMGLHDPFRHLKHKLWPKEGPGLQFPKWSSLGSVRVHSFTISYTPESMRCDSRPLKFGNRPDFLVWRWHVTYRWKALDEGYNFASDFISIRGVHAKLWAPKVVRVPVVGISGLPLGNLMTK